MADREPQSGDASVASPAHDAAPAWLPKALKDGRNQLIIAIVAGGIALSFALWLVGRLGNVFTILATALFLSFALEPAVDRLAKRGLAPGGGDRADLRAPDRDRAGC